MSRETLRNLIELVPESEIDTLYKVVIKFIPTETPELGELEALEEGKKDRAENGAIPHGAIDWE